MESYEGTPKQGPPTPFRDKGGDREGEEGLCSEKRREWAEVRRWPVWRVEQGSLRVWSPESLGSVYSV